MKTRHILTAIALPALLAACTQDELVEVTGQQNYSDVPMVEATFTAIKGDDVATKMATKFGWEVGDTIGLGWIGADQTTQANAQVIYDNPLFCIDPSGAFKVNTNLRVGQYVAYMPYAGLVNTGYVPFTVEGQGLYTTVDGAAKHFIYIDPKLANLVDKKAEDLDEGESEAGINKNIQLTMERLSNALTLNLNFSNHENLTDLKVYKVTMDADNGSTSYLAKSFAYFAKDHSTGFEGWDKVLSSTFFGTSNGYVANANQVGGLELASEDGVAVEGDQLTLYATMLPLTVTGNNTLNLYVTVETNYGNITCTTNWSDSKDNATIVASHKAYDATGAYTGIVYDETWGAADLFNKLGTSGILDVAIDATKIEKTQAEVTTQEELEELLASLATSGQKTAINIKVNPASNAKGIMTLTDFELGADVLCLVTLTAGANAGNGFVFEGDNVIAGQLKLASPAQLNGTMAVENNVNPLTGAQNTTLELGENLTVNPGAVLTNSGKISANSGKRLVTDKNVQGIVGLYVSAAKTASVDWTTNNGEMQWIDGVIANIDANGGPVFAEVSDMNGIDKVNEEKNVNKVNTLRIEEAADIEFTLQTNLKYIKTIDVNADTKITLAREVGASAIQLGEILNVAEGVTLDITGEGNNNGITFNWVNGHPAINVAANATFDVTNIKLGSTSSTINVTYAGTVNWTNVVTTGVTVNKTKVGNGIFTQTTED